MALNQNSVKTENGSKGRYVITKNDIWVLLLILPYYAVINHLLYAGKYFRELPVFAVATGITLILWPVSWYIHTLAGFRVRNAYPEISQTSTRVALSLMVFIPITFIQNFSQALIISHDHVFGVSLNRDDFRYIFIAGIMLNLIATAVFEATYLINKWKSSLIETEEFKKAYLQSELDNLKNQVNPHFLFNSINSLSYLIHEDPVKAEKFLSEMSKVYRYLLQNNDQELTPLHVELEFTASYYHLLKTRYEAGIVMINTVSPEYESCLLPPLTLQMLIENAVKHNTILERSPLVIRLYVNKQEQLVVENNIQKKSTSVESNKIGLKNIRSKYKLLNQENVIIEETEESFRVSIPLIKSISYEGIDS